MADDESELLLTGIIQLLAEDVDCPLDGTLLFAQLDSNWVAPSIYKERGNHILYRSPDLDRIGDPLIEFWEAQTSETRWAEMACLIRDGRFEVTYTYPDEIDHDEEPFDRRDRVVKQHLGDKPIVYPPMLDDVDGERYDL